MILCLTGINTKAQNSPAPQLRHIASLRSADAPDGSRVTITSDASLDDYAAYRSADRFHVLIPQAQLSNALNNLHGRGFTDLQIERRGADLDLSFGLQPGATARVNQKFNRLDVVFNAPSDAVAVIANAANQIAVSSAQIPANELLNPRSSLPILEKVSFSPTPEPTPEPQNAKSEDTKETIKATASAQAATSGGKSEIVLPPEKTRPVDIARFDKAPVIDGKLDDSIWQQAAVLKDFYQFRPGDNIAPSQPTEVLIGYDAKFLYFAFRAHDEAGKVRATIPKRDQIFDDDSVGLYLDTFNDRRRSYIVLFNPLGVQADGIFTESNGEDYSFDLVMESKGMLTDDGYTVEVAIPFKSLRYEAGKGKLWGVHVIRQIKRLNNETISWMPIRREVSGLLSQAGHITGLEGISTERTLELIPSLTISETGKRIKSLPLGGVNDLTRVTDPTRFINKPIELDPGLTLKYGITPTVTLDLALNPDFAQVEADQTVVTANQRFPIFFQEKRPFFLEGIDTFQTPLTAVHTRAIVDPDVAVKLTGKRGRNTFGLLLASDNAPGNFSEEERTDPDALPGIERFLDKNAYIGVLRLKRDVGQENSLGLIATTYNFIEKHNNLFG
ncbi:MAG: carbohydrate binding family 9 domain-containing protein, partial [Acidobacteria bacterium]|nr:carbohydrate binding family 9 domain-containing protein [Acidobacteriota bacterium]